MGSWYIEKGPESDVVISSRLRLARNFKDYLFPGRMDKIQAEQVLNRTREAVLTSSASAGDSFSFYRIREMNPIDRQILVEKHLISPDLSESKIDSGVIISRDERISIMINEEDHLRIQCLLPGLQLNEAWDLGAKIDSLLGERIDFAFSRQYGFLTSCPSNVGTGIRASAMLHLPALTMTGYISKVLEVCGKLGMTVRGLYGENSGAAGSLYQISNQITIGISEAEIIRNITNVINQISSQERTVRRELYKQNPYRFEDKIFRSFGILRNARIISSEESFRLVSDVRLGIEMGLIKGIEIEAVNEIMLLIQPANIQKETGRILTPDERDISRAEIIRKKLEIKEQE